MDPSSVGQAPALAARRWGRRTALIFGRERYSYADLRDRVASFSQALPALGLQPGQRAAIFMENRPEYLIAYFAVPAAGGVLVPLNTFLAPPELHAMLRDSGAALLIASPDSLRRIAPGLHRLPDLRQVLLCGDTDAVPARAPGGLHVARLEDVACLPPQGQAAGPAGDGSEEGADATAVIIYTSGTTGRPKGVMLSHRNLIANAEACVEAVGATPRDRVLLCLPMFHSFTEMVCMLAPVLSGMAVILCEKIDRAEIRGAIVKHRPTIFPAVPAVWAAMAQLKLGTIARWLNPVRLYISGGAPLSLETLRSFEGRYRRPLCEGYGLTEASPVVALSPPAGPRKPGSIGLPLPGVQVRVVDLEGRDVPPGKTGELLVKGPNVMKGYLGRHEETERALAGGWLHTGDLGRIDGDGYIFIMGRSKEMLICRGMNVYPREIENVLEEHPQVKEAAVIGVPDPARGEVPHAFVVPRPGQTLSEAELRRTCRRKLANYKVPRAFSLLPELPRNPAGKVLKETLRARASSHPSG